MSRPSKKKSTKTSSSTKKVELDEPMSQCHEILSSIMEKPDAAIFSEPVDWEAQGLPDYPEIIKHPMDLGTIKVKLEGGKYTGHDKFAHEMRLVWKNAMTYNRSDSEIYATAEKFSKQFEKKYANLKKTLGQKRKRSEKGGDEPKVTKEDRIKFSKLVNQLESDELGQLVDMIAKECPDALNEEDEEELEIELNQIDASVLMKLNKFAEGCIKKRKTS